MSKNKNTKAPVVVVEEPTERKISLRKLGRAVSNTTRSVGRAVIDTDLRDIGHTVRDGAVATGHGVRTAAVKTVSVFDRDSWPKLDAAYELMSAYSVGDVGTDAELAYEAYQAALDTARLECTSQEEQDALERHIAKQTKRMAGQVSREILSPVK